MNGLYIPVPDQSNLIAGLTLTDEQIASLPDEIKEGFWHTQVRLDSIDCGLVFYREVLMDYYNRGSIAEHTYECLDSIIGRLESATHELCQGVARLAENEAYRVTISEAWKPQIHNGIVAQNEPAAKPKKQVGKEKK